MDFAEILDEKYRYAFTDAICYISVRSIEAEYARLYPRTSSKYPDRPFDQFIGREAATDYACLTHVYDFVMMNPRKQPMTRREQQARAERLSRIPIDTKIAHLIHADGLTGNLSIHPMLALVFAISINVHFAVDVLGHISAMRLAGCHVDPAIGSPWEELDNRELTIAEYKRSANLGAVLVNDLQSQISALKKELAAEQNANERLQTMLDARNVSRCTAAARFCAWVSRVCRSRRVAPEGFRDINDTAKVPNGRKK